MGRKALNLLESTFGKLKVLNRVLRRDTKNSYWSCECECGKAIVVSGTNLKTGNTKSCGCLSQPAQEENETAEFKAWQQMIQRCHNTNNKSYYRYGSRGISVCHEWKNSFRNFLKDMGSKPGNNFSLDRIDNNKGYSPDNCSWRSVEDQNNNRGNYNILVEFQGEIKTASQWANIYGLNASTVIGRINRGWSIHNVLNTPIRKYKGLSK